MGKSLGSTLDFAEERIAELMLCYDRYIASCRYIRMSEVFAHIVAQPCSRFWVSPFRAAVVVGDMLRGRSISHMHPSRQEMFKEIYSRVALLRSKNPSASLFRLVSDVVIQPAPKFYLTPSSAKIMFYKAKREWYIQKKQKMPKLRLQLSSPQQ